MGVPVAGLLALMIAACGTPATQVRGAFAAAGLPRVDVTMSIPPGHAADSDRYLYAALTTLAASDQDVTVDLAAVDFIDLAATRALVLAAQAMSGHQRLVVTSPPPVMAMILQTCWH